jgi:hypothetical protein
MKKLFLLLFLVSMSGFSQEKISITPTGVAPVVIEMPSQTAAELYKKTKEWINIYYKNPKEVLKGDIENDLIRIDGFAVGGYKTKSLGLSTSYDYSYTIEIQFKDNKIRYDYQVGQFWAAGARCVYDYTDFFKNDGTVRKVHQYSYETINQTINDNYISFCDYLSGKTQAQKKDW